ncbi:MAG: FAD-binding oxidoreductase [Actinomycetota bacterium]
MSSELPKGLPPEIILADAAPYRSDWWAVALLADRRDKPFPAPLAAVRPRSTEEVALVLEWARANGLIVVPRGGGSGVCGGAVPGEGSVVLDLTGMDRILDVDEQSGVVRAEAGVGGPRLEAALGEAGFTLGHVPQSFHLSTLGGWISTKATGQLSTRYGGIEDRLLGLTAVAADGTVLSSRASPRSAAGPDWWRLFLGAEGVLGVVTEATLEAWRIPETAHWISYRSSEFALGLETLRRLVQEGVRPAVARLYDPADTGVSFGRLGIGGTLLILRQEGPRRVVDAEVALVRSIAEDEGLEDAGPAPGEHWWNHRFDAVETYRKLLAGEGALGKFGVVDTMEVAAFWSGLGRLYEKVGSALSEHVDGVLAHVSHLYSSGANIYFTFLISSASDEQHAESRYRKAWQSGMRATLEAGGTITHHHGVGLLKAPWLEPELGTGVEALRRIKEAFDPNGSLNPGKLGLGEFRGFPAR